MGVLGRPRSCKICDHPDRHEIDVGLVMKETNYNQLSIKYPGYSREAFRRHFTYHLGTDERKRIYADEVKRREVAATAEAEEIVAAGKVDVIDSLERLAKECHEVLKKAKTDGDGDMRLKAIAELRRQVELAARILGDLTDVQNQTIIVAGHPEWLKIRDVILTVLERHPAAKADFVKTVGGLAGAKQQLLT